MIYYCTVLLLLPPSALQCQEVHPHYLLAVFGAGCLRHTLFAFPSRWLKSQHIKLYLIITSNIQCWHKNQCAYYIVLEHHVAESSSFNIVFWQYACGCFGAKLSWSWLAQTRSANVQGRICIHTHLLSLMHGTAFVHVTSLLSVVTKTVQTLSRTFLVFLLLMKRQ